MSTSVILWLPLVFYHLCRTWYFTRLWCVYYPRYFTRLWCVGCRWYLTICAKPRISHVSGAFTSLVFYTSLVLYGIETMPPKISIDAKLEELHTFVSENIALFASRAGGSVQGCLRKNHSKVESYWYTLLFKHSGAGDQTWAPRDMFFKLLVTPSIVSLKCANDLLSPRM